MKLNCLESRAKAPDSRDLSSDDGLNSDDFVDDPHRRALQEVEFLEMPHDSDSDFIKVDKEVTSVDRDLADASKLASSPYQVRAGIVLFVTELFQCADCVKNFKRDAIDNDDYKLVKDDETTKEKIDNVRICEFRCERSNMPWQQGRFLAMNSNNKVAIGFVCCGDVNDHIFCSIPRLHLKF